MLRGIGRGVQRLGLVIAITGLGFGGANAQSNPTENGSLAPDLKQQAPARAAAPVPIGSVKSLDACPFGAEGTVILTKVTVTGATLVTPREVDAAVAGLLGHSSDLSVFCTARDRVAGLFARKGYRLTRVDIPPQNVKSGQLELLATEGYVAGIDADGLLHMGPSADLAKAILQTLAPHDTKSPAKPLPWSRLERAVLLARDIPGADIGVRLHASPAGPGAVDLVASATGRRRFDVSVGVQDMGSKQLGQVGGYVRVDANSFTPFGDRTSLLFYGTTTGAQKVVELLEGGNIGASGLRGELDLTYARTEPQADLKPLGIAGDFFDIRFDLTYPVIRSQALNVTADVGFDVINQRNSLGALRGPAGTPVLFRDKLRVLHAEGSLRWDPEAFKPIEFKANVELRQGIGALGSSKFGDPNLSRATGDPAALVERGDATLRWTLGGRPTYDRLGGPWVQVTGRLQHAGVSLLAYEQFQIGNYTVARGFDPGAASGDTAYAVQTEAGMPIRFSLLNQKLSVEPFAFYDRARIENHAGGYNTTDSSVGGGVRTRLPWGARLDIYYADPLTAPIPGAKRPGGRVLVNLTYVHSFK